MVTELMKYHIEKSVREALGVLNGSAGSAIQIYINLTHRVPSQKTKQLIRRAYQKAEVADAAGR